MCHSRNINIQLEIYIFFASAHFFYGLDIYNAVTMKVEPTKSVFTTQDNPYIHLEVYKVTYRHPVSDYRIKSQDYHVRRVGILYFYHDVCGP